ncbi:MAG: NAD(P)/FAD-dependent oxidoreductase, partial [Candidatus Limnocylindria bacterium]
AGLATAYALAREGVRVAVLERDRVASAASGRNAGFVLAGVAENYVAACRRYGPERTARVWRVTTRNRALLRAAVEAHGIACDLAWNGSDQVAGDEAEWAEAHESARLLAAEGVRVAVDERARTVRYEDDGELHPARFVRGLAATAESAGARIFEGTAATRIDADRVVTAGGTVRAGAVVVCLNAHLQRLLPRPRIAPTRGQMLATAPLSRRVFARPAYANRGYRYWRQRADGCVLVGGWRDTAVEEEVGEEERTTERIQRQLDAFLRERGVDALVTHRWAGIMGFSHDALPYAGRLPGGVYVNAGFTGHGMAFTMATGEILAALVREGRHADADLFDPERP